MDDRERLAHRGPLGLPLLVAALAGAAIAGYLSVARLAGEPAVCGPSQGCETVAQSVYSEVLGFLPVAYLGLAFSVVLVGLAAGWWQRAEDRRMLLAAYGLLLLGTLFAAYLTYLELFVIEAIFLPGACRMPCPSSWRWSSPVSPWVAAREDRRSLASTPSERVHTPSAERRPDRPAGRHRESRPRICEPSQYTTPVVARVSSSCCATVGERRISSSSPGTVIVQAAGYVAPVAGLVQRSVTLIANAVPSRCRVAPSGATRVPYAREWCRRRRARGKR